jgi:hypothetical protein
MTTEPIAYKFEPEAARQSCRAAVFVDKFGKPLAELPALNSGWSVLCGGIEWIDHPTYETSTFRVPGSTSSCLRGVDHLAALGSKLAHCGRPYDTLWVPRLKATMLRAVSLVDMEPGDPEAAMLGDLRGLNVGGTEDPIETMAFGSVLTYGQRAEFNASHWAVDLGLIRESDLLGLPDDRRVLVPYLLLGAALTHGRNRGRAS